MEIYGGNCVQRERERKWKARISEPNFMLSFDIDFNWIRTAAVFFISYVIRCFGYNLIKMKISQINCSENIKYIYVYVLAYMSWEWHAKEEISSRRAWKKWE